MNVNCFLSNIVKKILAKLNIKNIYEIDLRRSITPKFGHYQINGIMKIAENLKTSAMELAENIKKILNLRKEISRIDVLKPGYINIFLDPYWISENLKDMINDTRLGIRQTKIPKKIVIDYSSPNIAKEMHVGHLRSTIIGDSVVRILEFLGHNVIRCNHIGDWGTNFGVLIAYLKENNIEIEKLKLQKIEEIYCKAIKNCDEDKNFFIKSRNYVIKLQSGDSECIKIWKHLVKITMDQNNKIYKILNVTLKKSDVMGESTYNHMLPEIIKDLTNKGLTQKKNGSMIITLNSFKNKLGESMGVVIQKKDGSYLYSTTEIASIKYRYEKLKAERIIYYVDFRQQQHLMQIFQIVRQAKYVSEKTQLEHHSFGMIMNKNFKPFKTRSGNTIKLLKLIKESIKRSKNKIKLRNPKIKNKELNKISNILGIGAIKYADLSKNRTTNYIFDWDKMLNFEGNTIIYIQYAYVRAISIVQNIEKNILKNDILSLQEKQEIILGINLLQLEETLYKISDNGMPHILCNYLYELTNAFSNFYETCNILKETNKNKKITRIKLVLITSQIIKKGLNLLGINVIKKM